MLAAIPDSDLHVGSLTVIYRQSPKLGVLWNIKTTYTGTCGQFRFLPLPIEEDWGQNLGVFVALQVI
jgi:hypothetical protein